MIQVLDRAFGILEHLAQHGDAPVFLGDLAQATGLNPATCARICASLAARGYVEQEARRKGWRLGPAAWALTARAPYRSELLRAAQAPLAELARQCGETATLAALRQQRRVVLATVEGEQAVMVHAGRLEAKSPWSTATGRILLAYAPDPAPLLEADGRPGAEWPEAAADLPGALAALRQAAACEHRPSPDVLGLAVPVLVAGRCACALGVHLPSSRAEAAHLALIRDALATAAAAIAGRLAKEHP